MLNDIFKTIGEINKAVDTLNAQLQQMQKSINEYTQITNNVFGGNSMPAVNKVQVKENNKVATPTKTKSGKRRKIAKVRSLQERMEIIEALESKELTTAEACELYGTTKAYIYNLLSDYRHGKFDNAEAKRELEIYNEEHGQEENNETT